jgi:hypothetical protein
MSERKIITETAAKLKICPFRKDGDDYCITTKCMAWTQTYEKIEREDHSGGKDAIISMAAQRAVSGCRPERVGPNGCYGTWVLDACGKCTY